MIVQLSALLTDKVMRCCWGLSPSAPLWGHVPGAVRRLFDFQTRADIRVRVRSIVIRIRIRHTAIRVRIVVPAIDHTAYWEMPPSCYKGKQYLAKSCKNATVSAQYGASRPFFQKNRPASPEEFFRYAHALTLWLTPFHLTICTRRRSTL